MTSQKKMGFLIKVQQLQVWSVVLVICDFWSRGTLDAVCVYVCRRVRGVYEYQEEMLRKLMAKTKAWIETSCTCMMDAFFSCSRCSLCAVCVPKDTPFRKKHFCKTLSQHFTHLLIPPHSLSTTANHDEDNQCCARHHFSRRSMPLLPRFFPPCPFSFFHPPPLHTSPAHSCINFTYPPEHQPTTAF